MNKTIIIVGVVIIILAGLLFILKGLEGNLSPSPQTNQNTEDRAQDNVFGLSFEDFEGNAVALEDFMGSPIVLNVWATWCPFCVNELPDFVNAQKEFGKNVTIVAINREESLNQARGYTDDLQITDDLTFLLDPSDSFYNSIGGFGMPETLFINSSGEVVFHKRGPMDLDEIKSRIQDIL